MFASSAQNQGQEITTRSVVITVIIGIFTVLQFFLQGSLSVMAHEIKKDFDIDAASMSLLSSAFFYSYILLQIPVGLILDKMGMKKTCFASLILMGLSCISFAMSKSFELAFVSRLVMGVGASFGFISLLRSIKLFFPQEKFIFIMSLAEFSTMIGIAFCNIFFSYLTDALHWRASIYTTAFLCFVLAVIWWKLDVQDNVADSSHKGEGGSSANELSTASILKKVFSYRLIWFNGLYTAFLYSIITVFVALWGIPYTEKLYDLTTTEAAFLVSFVYFGLGLSSLMLSWIVTFFPMKVALRGFTFLSLFFLAWYIYLPPSNIYFAYLLLFLAGASCAVYQLAFSIVSENVSKEIQSTAGGVTNMFCMLGAPILQPLVGFALTLTQGTYLDGYESYTVNQYKAAFLVLIFCLALAFIFSWFVFPQKRDSKLS